MSRTHLTSEEAWVTIGGCQVWCDAHWERGAHAGTSDQGDGQTATERRWPHWPPHTAGSVTAGLMLGCCWAQHQHRSHHNTTAATTQARSEYVLEVFIDYKMCYALKFFSYFVHDPALFSGRTPAVAAPFNRQHGMVAQVLPPSLDYSHLVTMTQAVAREAPAPSNTV